MPQADAGLLDAVCRRDPRALAQAISLLERHHPNGSRLLSALDARTGRARVIGLTGPTGAGKSSLADRLVSAWRARDATVAVLAVDPTSPSSGGAILGDRLRLGAHAHDRGVFVRSMASRGRPGGLAAATDPAIRLLDAAGFDIILVETVGAGQNDVAVADVADLTLLVAPPNGGDEVQAMKAGLMEIADVVIVNKADLTGADQMVSTLEAAMALADDASRPVVVRTVATRAEGIDDLIAAIDHAWQRLAGTITTRRVTRSTTRTLLPAATGFSLDHVGIAVADAGPLAARLAELFALVADVPEDVGDHRVQFLEAGPVALELVEPRSSDAAAAKFIARRGTALHHLCFAVPDLTQAADRLRQQGVRFVDDEPQPGARGARILFIHPSSTGGVLVELQEAAATRRPEGPATSRGNGT